MSCGRSCTSGPFAVRWGDVATHSTYPSICPTKHVGEHRRRDGAEEHAKLRQSRISIINRTETRLRFFGVFIGHSLIYASARNFVCPCGHPRGCLISGIYIACIVSTPEGRAKLRKQAFRARNFIHRNPHPLKNVVCLARNFATTTLPRQGVSDVAARFFELSCIVASSRYVSAHDKALQPSTSSWLDPSSVVSCKTDLKQMHDCNPAFWGCR